MNKPPQRPNRRLLPRPVIPVKNTVTPPPALQPKAITPLLPIVQKVAVKPVAPPVYRPQPVPKVLQKKRLTIPPSQTEQTALQAAGLSSHQGVIQRAKKGSDGGKAGVSYTSVGMAYSQDDINKAMADVGIKGVKGHKKGKSGSGESGQTKNENAKLAQKLRENKEKEKEKKSGCRKFHNKRNSGEKCPSCGQIVD